MQEQTDAAAQKIFGRTLTEAHAKSICVDCATPVNEDSFKDEISKVEYGMSGFCQVCQDRVFAEPEPEDVSVNAPAA